MAACVVCIVIALQMVSASEHSYKNEGFIDHLSNGMKLAQNLLGSESVALKVADFVVRAFNTVTAAPAADGQQRPGEARPPPGARGAPWRHLLRLLGLHTNQLSAVAVNALIFVAQMIMSFLARPGRPGEPHRSDDPTDWILNKNSRKLQDIIATAKNESLTDLVEDIVAEYGTREETGCIRLLVCKIAPFVSRMQDAVFSRPDGRRFDKDLRGAAALYRHLPSNEQLIGRSEACEKKFPDCDLNE